MNEDERRDDLSLKNWDMHHKIKTDSLKEIDHIVLLVSTGAFGISIAFLSFMRGQIIDWEIILASWTFFLFSICSCTGLHLFNAWGSIRCQHLINHYRETKGKPSPSLVGSIKENMDTSQDPKVKKYDKWARYARFCSIFFLCWV